MKTRKMANDSVDTRAFELVYVPYVLSITGKTIYFSQRELRLIMKHVEGRNAHIYNKLKDFISAVDKQEGRITDFDERVPKTHIIRLH